MNVKELVVHTVVGGMTTDYFSFFCKKCMENLGALEFLGLIRRTPWFRGICPRCKEIYDFKIEVIKGRHLMMNHPES